MNLKYKPHTPRLQIVDQYTRELFRDELPVGIKFHDANHTLHPTRGVVAVANRIAISENISEHDRELLIAAAYFHDTGYIRWCCSSISLPLVGRERNMRAPSNKTIPSSRRPTLRYWRKRRLRSGEQRICGNAQLLFSLAERY